MREEQISEVMERYVQNEEIAGASLLVRQHGQTVYRNCWGYADKAAKTTIQENSIFRMMSMTKCVTAVGILQLMEAGKLNLDDPFPCLFRRLRSRALQLTRDTDGMTA